MLRLGSSTNANKFSIGPSLVTAPYEAAEHHYGQSQDSRVYGDFGLLSPLETPASQLYTHESKYVHDVHPSSSSKLGKRQIQTNLW